jgi:hypothetical protein
MSSRIPVVLLIIFASGRVLAQEPLSDEATSKAEQALQSQKIAAAEVQKFAFALADNRETKLKLHETPILRYTNPLRGEVHSALYMWTHEGRPEVVASVSNWFAPRPYLGLAVTSLSQAKLVGFRDGQEIWLPQSPGVELRPVPDAQPPAGSPAQRLRQMSALAREFSAEFQREARYNEGGKLRLMTRPLYRYESTTSEVQDGALFALADGTSPQLNLLIESRKTGSGHQWQYALAPNNSVEYHAFHKDREIWSLPQLAPPWPNSKNPLGTYTVFPDLQNDNRTRELADQLTKAVKNRSNPATE